MTQSKNAGRNPSREITQALALAALSLLAACGMRSAMYVSASDAGAPSGTLGGAAGPGGSAGNGQVTSTGGVLATDAKNPTGQGGSVVSTAQGVGGATTMAMGGRGGTGGAGGSVASGGNGGRGGAAGNAGSGGRGGTGGLGGSGGTGGTTVLHPDAAPLRADALEVARPVGTPVIDPNNNYVTVNAGTVVLSGFAVSSCAGAGSMCGAPTYTETSFCASGTVGASPTYKAWANAGFSVNQAQSGASGSTSSLAFSGSSITVSYSNKGGSPLELQLWDGSNYWCAYLKPSTGANTVTIPFSSLNTACWDSSGTAFVSGTPIDTIQFVVPSTATSPTPYDFCFLGMTVQ
jgi:hypothetical protein